MLFRLLLTDPATFILIAFPLLYSLVLHEMGHAVAAAHFGDYTAKSYGRFSLNPLKHLDPVGTLMLLFLGFGWAKPVPVNYYYLRPQKTGIICCALAGVTVNFLIAFLSLFMFKLSVLFFPVDKLQVALMVTAQINLLLASFNLIPIPPLDGSRVLTVLSPPSWRNFLYNIERYGMLIIIVLLYAGILNPIIDFIMNILLAIIGLIL